MLNLANSAVLTEIDRECAVGCGFAIGLLCAPEAIELLFFSLITKLSRVIQRAKVSSEQPFTLYTLANDGVVASDSVLTMAPRC